MLLNKNSNEDSRKRRAERDTQQSAPKDIDKLIAHAGPCQATTDQAMCRDMLTPLACRTEHKKRNLDWIFVRLINCKAIGCDGIFSLLRCFDILFYSFICEPVSFGAPVRYHQVVCLISSRSQFSISVFSMSFQASHCMKWNKFRKEQQNGSWWISASRRFGILQIFFPFVILPFQPHFLIRRWICET